MGKRHSAMQISSGQAVDGLFDSRFESTTIQTVRTTAQIPITHMRTLLILFNLALLECSRKSPLC